MADRLLAQLQTTLDCCNCGRPTPHSKRVTDTTWRCSYCLTPSSRGNPSGGINVKPPPKKVRDLVEEATAKRPKLATRLQRAERLVTHGHVIPLPLNGLWSVKSQTNEGKVYTVKPGDQGSCTCPDYREAYAPGGWCKHRLAVEMIIKLQEANGYHEKPRQRPDALTPEQAEVLIQCAAARFPILI